VNESISQRTTRQRLRSRVLRAIKQNDGKKGNIITIIIDDDDDDDDAKGNAT
jgi:hypothetical protein